jgi:uncharacterized protein (TIGR02996 family)
MTPTELETGFLAEIKDDPLDDVPWLVLADWLEDNRDPRAELVRLQLHLRGEVSESERLGAEERVRQLLRADAIKIISQCNISRFMKLAADLIDIKPWIGPVLSEMNVVLLGN